MRHPFILSIPLLLPSAALPATGLGGTSFCFGDGSGATCPCANGNNGSNGPAGCANGTNPGGGRLSDSGCASLDEKSLVLLGTGLPTCGNAKSVLFLQGLQAPNAGQGQAFYADSAA